MSEPANSPDAKTLYYAVEALHRAAESARREAANLAGHSPEAASWLTRNADAAEVVLAALARVIEERDRLIRDLDDRVRSLESWRDCEQEIARGADN